MWHGIFRIIYQVECPEEFRWSFLKSGDWPFLPYSSFPKFIYLSHLILLNLILCLKVFVYVCKKEPYILWISKVRDMTVNKRRWRCCYLSNAWRAGGPIKGGASGQQEWPDPPLPLWAHPTPLSPFTALSSGLQMPCYFPNTPVFPRLRDAALQGGSLSLQLSSSRSSNNSLLLFKIFPHSFSQWGPPGPPFFETDLHFYFSRERTTL